MRCHIHSCARSFASPAQCFDQSRPASKVECVLFFNNTQKIVKMFCSPHAQAAEWGINWEYFRSTPDRPSQPWLMDDFAACISGGVQFWKVFVPAAHRWRDTWIQLCFTGKLPPWIWAMPTTLRIRWPLERKDEYLSLHSRLVSVIRMLESTLRRIIFFFISSAAVNDLFISDFTRLIVDRVETWSLIKRTQFPGPQWQQYRASRLFLALCSFRKALLQHVLNIWIANFQYTLWNPLMENRLTSSIKRSETGLVPPWQHSCLWR